MLSDSGYPQIAPRPTPINKVLAQPGQRDEALPRVTETESFQLGAPDSWRWYSAFFMLRYEALSISRSCSG